jgi:hypothetical protein
MGPGTRRSHKIGWFPDPSRRHRLRYRDRSWTIWVADAGDAERDVEGLAGIRRTRRRHWLVALGALLAVGLLGFGTYVIGRNAGQDRADKMITELNGWTLPSTVVRSPNSDIVKVEGFGAPDVTRYYEPRGMPVAQAMDDLAAALRRQGYNDLEGDSSGALGSCHATPNCFMDILVMGNRIRAHLNESP